MVELRQPPGSEIVVASQTHRSSGDRWAQVQVALLAVIVALLVWLLSILLSPGERGPGDPEHLRELAARLMAVGALDESAALTERYLEIALIDSETRANVAFGLAESYLERGRPERALRWFYEAEGLGSKALADELGRKIVHTLERLGRPHAAQAALESRVRLDSGGNRAASDRVPGDRAPDQDNDPVVARVAGREIRRSEVARALDDTGAPPRPRTGQQREELLRRFVAEELVFRRAQKLEYDRDPEVVGAIERLARQLAISRFVEHEVVGGLQVAEIDLVNYFEANRKRYAGKRSPETVRLEEVREAVERDYRQVKAQEGYQELIDGELATADVELFPERLGDG